MKRYGARLDSTTQQARKILRFFEKNKGKISPLLILAHDYPDPDTLASAYALQYLAEHAYGVTSKIVYGGVIGRMENREMMRLLKIPAKKLSRSDFKKYQHFALVDTQPSFRNNSFPEGKHATIVIDQHASDVKPSADLIVIDTECGATSVLLAKALILKKMNIPVPLATSLAYGIISDTLNLYRVRRKDILETYLDILPRCDLRLLASIQNPLRSRRFFVSVSEAIQKAVVHQQVVISHLSKVESPDLVAQIADFLVTYKRMEWAMCTGRYKKRLYVSLRTKNINIPAGEILRGIFENEGEAGGHGSIAGGSFKVGPLENEALWEEAEKNLALRLLKRLRVPVKSDFYFPFRQK